MDIIRRFVVEEEGQNMVEYALVLTLVAIGAVVGLGAAGTAINSWFNTLGGYVGTLSSQVP